MVATDSVLLHVPCLQCKDFCGSLEAAALPQHAEGQLSADAAVFDSLQDPLRFQGLVQFVAKNLPDELQVCGVCEGAHLWGFWWNWSHSQGCSTTRVPAVALLHCAISCLAK
jgi:hypothetical protein